MAYFLFQNQQINYNLTLPYGDWMYPEYVLTQEDRSYSFKVYLGHLIA